MARVFCENCGRQRRAVEAVGAYEGTPYCEPCKKGDDIPEQDFVRFGVQSSASDAKPAAQVATPKAAAPGYVVYDPQKATATAKRGCVDCGAVVRVRRGSPSRLQCRNCEKKAKKPITSADTIKLQVEHFKRKVIPNAARAVAREVLTERRSVPVLLSDDDYQKLKPHAAHNDLTRQLLAQIGMIVAVKGPKQGRLKLDAKRGDTRNLAMRIRRLLRTEKITAEVEAFIKASCIVVSVGYGKQAK